MASFGLWHVTRVALLSLAIHHGVSAQANITDDTYFYGQSPPVYPSRKFSLAHQMASADFIHSTDAGIGPLGGGIFESGCTRFPNDAG